MNAQQRVSRYKPEHQRVTGLRNKVIGNIPITLGKPDSAIVLSYGIDIHTGTTVHIHILPNLTGQGFHQLPGPVSSSVPVVLNIIVFCWLRLYPGTTEHLGSQGVHTNRERKEHGVTGLRYTATDADSHIGNRKPHGTIIALFSVDIHAGTAKDSRVGTSQTVGSPSHRLPCPVNSAVPVVLDVVVHFDGLRFNARGSILFGNDGNGGHTFY